MAEAPTIRELFYARKITGQEIRDAATSVLAGGGSPAFPISEGYALDLSSAVASYANAVENLADPVQNERSKWAWALMAILLARPAKG